MLKPVHIDTLNTAHEILAPHTNVNAQAEVNVGETTPSGSAAFELTFKISGNITADEAASLKAKIEAMTP